MVKAKLPLQPILVAHVNLKDKGALTVIRRSGARQACHLEAGWDGICTQDPLQHPVVLSGPGVQSMQLAASM